MNSAKDNGSSPIYMQENRVAKVNRAVIAGARKERQIPPVIG